MGTPIAIDKGREDPLERLQGITMEGDADEY
jgi:hypothetical protein